MKNGLVLIRSQLVIVKTQNNIDANDDLIKNKNDIDVNNVF